MDSSPDISNTIWPLRSVSLNRNKYYNTLSSNVASYVNKANASQDTVRNDLDENHVSQILSSSSNTNTDDNNYAARQASYTPLTTHALHMHNYNQELRDTLDENSNDSPCHCMTNAFSNDNPQSESHYSNARDYETSSGRETDRLENIGHRSRLNATRYSCHSLSYGNSIVPLTVQERSQNDPSGNVTRTVVMHDQVAESWDRSTVICHNSMAPGNDLAGIGARFEHTRNIGCASID